MSRPPKTTYTARAITLVDWPALARLQIEAGIAQDGRVVMRERDWVVAIREGAAKISAATKAREVVGGLDSALDTAGRLQ